MRKLTVADIMSRRVSTVRADARLSPGTLLHRMRRFRHLPVVDPEGHPLGMLTRTDLLEQALVTGGRQAVEVQRHMSGPAEVARTNELVEIAARRMLELRVHALPVVDEAGRLTGIVTDTDVLCAVGTGAAQPLRPADAPVDLVMTDYPATLAPDDTLADAARAMLEAEVRHLPVVDADRRVLGIVSERDLRLQLGVDVLRFTEAPSGALDTPVGDAMTENPITIRSGTRLADAVEALVAEKVGALPVLDADDRLTGILSYVDVLAWLRNELARTGDLRTYAGAPAPGPGEREAAAELARAAEQPQPEPSVDGSEPTVGEVAATIAHELSDDELQEIRNTGSAEDLRAVVRERELGHGWGEREVDACIDLIERMVLPRS